MFVINVSKKYKNKLSPCKLLVESFRDPNGISRHRTILNLSKLPPKIAQAIEVGAADKTAVALDDLTQPDNRSLGEVLVLKRLADRLGLTKILEEKLGRIVSGLVLAMTFNRVSLPKARYSLREWLETTCLPELLKLKLPEFHYNNLYPALARLADQQSGIENALWQETQKREEGLVLMLYDITSTYLEGDQNELAAYGYNRDRKKGKKQITIGLVATPQGRPVAVEVFKGNTTDKTTLLPKIEELKKRFDLKEVVYVFDRGMHDEGKRAQLRWQKIPYITALNRGEINRLIEKGAPIQPSLFDEREIAEYEEDGRRYIICQSDVATRNTRQRQQLLEKTSEKLASIRRNVNCGRLKDPVKISARVEKWLAKWKVKKFFTVTIKEEFFAYARNQDLIEQAEKLDQLYVLEASGTKLAAAEVQRGYKNLSVAEDGFRTVKTYLKIRPVNHRLATTTKGHVFVCFLALYLRRELEILLGELLDGQVPKRGYTFSYLMTQLREIRQSTLVAGEHRTQIINQLQPIQREILSALRTRITPIKV